MKTLLDLYVTWFKIGLFTFGGGYAMLPMIEREVIDKRHWATEEEVVDYYAIGQCTPGVIAVNTATFIGYKIKKDIGGIVATLGVISPSLIIISLISKLISNFSGYPIVQHALGGIRVAVCVLMFVSIKNLIKKGLRDVPGWLIFAAAFILSYFVGVSTVILVVGAGAAGYTLYLVNEKKKKKAENDTGEEKK